MSNSKTDYNTFVRANLPYYITYDSVRNQYVTINGKRFVTYKEAKWYMDYIIKFGYPLNPLGGYAANGFIPELGYDFVNEVYVVNSAPTTVNFERSGAATMVDSDGVLKWSPHNLAINSTTPATQSITVVSGVDYTVECTGAGSITISGAGTGSVTAGSPVEVTASTATLTLTVVGSLDTMWAYRSDLGGMVNNPETGNSYVSTTATARYLPRVGSHVYDGSTWVNEGLLHEEAATNLFLDSNDFDVANAALPDEITIAQDATGPDGETSAWTMTDDGVSGIVGSSRINQEIFTTTPGAYTFAVDLKAGNNSWAYTQTNTAWDVGAREAWFNLATGVTGTVDDGLTARMVPVGNGFYRCTITMTETVGGGGRRLFIALADTDGDRDIIQDGTNSIIAANSQLETGSIPTSYISTLGAQATRAADTWTADLPDTSQTVSIQMGGLLSYADTGLARELGFYLLQDAANEYIEAYLNTAGSNTGTLVFRTQAAASGLTQVSQAGYLTPGINQPFNVASRHTATVIGGASDGTYIYTNTPTVFPSVGDTDLQIGFPGFNGYIRQLLVWADDIGAAGTAEATA